MTDDGRLTPAQAAEYLKVSVKSLQRWDKQGNLMANKTATGRRWYTKTQLDAFLVAGNSQPAALPTAAAIREAALPPRVRSVPGAPIITDPSDQNYIPEEDNE